MLNTPYTFVIFFHIELVIIQTTSILSHYHKSTCRILNYSVKMSNLTVKRKLKVQLQSFFLCIHVSINLIY